MKFFIIICIIVAAAYGQQQNANDNNSSPKPQPVGSSALAGLSGEYFICHQYSMNDNQFNNNLKMIVAAIEDNTMDITYSGKSLEGQDFLIRGNGMLSPSGDITVKYITLNMEKNYTMPYMHNQNSYYATIKSINEDLSKIEYWIASNDCRSCKRIKVLPESQAALHNIPKEVKMNEVSHNCQS